MVEQWKQWKTFLGGSKITADGDCSHEIQRHLFLGRKVMTNLNSILKSRDITLPTKVHLVKAMVFPVVMYGCESLTIKKAEHRRNGCFWTVVLEKTLESPLDSKRIKLVNPKGNQFSSVQLLSCVWLFATPRTAACQTSLCITNLGVYSNSCPLPEYLLEGLMLKLQSLAFGHLMWRANSLEKTLMLGKTEGRKKRGWQKMRWLDGTTYSMDMSLS